MEEYLWINCPERVLILVARFYGSMEKGDLRGFGECPLIDNQIIRK